MPFDLGDATVRLGIDATEFRAKLDEAKAQYDSAIANMQSNADKMTPGRVTQLGLSASNASSAQAVNAARTAAIAYNSELAGTVTQAKLANLELDKQAKQLRLNTAETGQWYQQMSRVSTSFATLGIAAGALAAPFAILGKESLEDFRKFDSQLQQSVAIMGNVSGTMRGDLANAALDASHKFAFSAADIAKSYYYLASSGLTAEQSIKTLPTALTFAQASMTDAATATEKLTQIQSALGMGSTDLGTNLNNMAKISNTVIGVMSMTKTTADQLTDAFRNKAATAITSFNIPLADAAAVLATFADRGVRGAQAGTYFDMVVRNLTIRAHEHAAAWEHAGLAVYDAQKNLRPMGDILADLGNKLKGLNADAKVGLIKDLGFDTRGQFSVRILTQAVEQYDKFRTAILNMGEMSKSVADKQLESFNSKMVMLGNVATDAKIRIGAVLADQVIDSSKSGLIKWLSDAVTGFAALSKEEQSAKVHTAEIVFAFVSFVGVAALSAAAITRIGMAILMLNQALGGSATAVGLLRGSLLGLSFGAVAYAAYEGAKAVQTFQDKNEALLSRVPFFARGIAAIGGTFLQGTVNTAYNAVKYDSINTRASLPGVPTASEMLGTPGMSGMAGMNYDSAKSQAAAAKAAAKALKEAEHELEGAFSTLSLKNVPKELKDLAEAEELVSNTLRKQKASWDELTLAQMASRTARRELQPQEMVLKSAGITSGAEKTEDIDKVNSAIESLSRSSRGGVLNLLDFVAANEKLAEKNKELLPDILAVVNVTDAEKSKAEAVSEAFDTYAAHMGALSRVTVTSTGVAGQFTNELIRQSNVITLLKAKDQERIDELTRSSTHSQAYKDSIAVDEALERSGMTRQQVLHANTEQAELDYNTLANASRDEGVTEKQVLESNIRWIEAYAKEHNVSAASVNKDYLNMKAAVRDMTNDNLTQLSRLTREGTSFLTQFSAATVRALLPLGQTQKRVTVRDEAATADLGLQLGLSGTALDELAKKLESLSVITGAGFASTVTQVTGIFKTWKVATADQSGALDMFYKTAVVTHVSVKDLMDQIDRSGPTLAKLGYNLTDSVALLGAMSGAGLDTSATVAAMDTAMKSLVSKGYSDPAAAIKAVFDSIKNASTDVAARTIAVAQFGDTVGPQLSTFVRTTGMNFDTLSGQVKNSSASYITMADSIKKSTDAQNDQNTTAARFHALLVDTERAIVDLGLRIALESSTTQLFFKNAIQGAEQLLTKLPLIGGAFAKIFPAAGGGIDTSVVGNVFKAGSPGGTGGFAGPVGQGIDTSVVGDVFGGGSSGGAGGMAGMLSGGLGSWVGAGVSAASGIVTGMQLSHIGSDVNFIEKSTRFAWLTLGSGENSIAAYTLKTSQKIVDVVDRVERLRDALFDPVNSTLERIELNTRGGGRGGSSITINNPQFVGLTQDMANELMTMVEQQFHRAIG